MVYSANNRKMKSMITRPVSGTGGAASVNSGGTSGGDRGGGTVVMTQQTSVKSDGRIKTLAKNESVNEKPEKEERRRRINVPLIPDKKILRAKNSCGNSPIFEDSIPLPGETPKKKEEPGIINSAGKEENNVPTSCDKDKEDGNKSGVVSFSFKKTGTKIASASSSAFSKDAEEEDCSTQASDGVKDFINDNNNASSVGNDSSVKSASSQSVSVDAKPRPVLGGFIKVMNKDETMELDWPAEMIKMTETEPKIKYSCNPLCFDFSELSGKPKKVISQDDTTTPSKSEEVTDPGSEVPNKVEDQKEKDNEENKNVVDNEENKNVVDEKEKTKSKHKKKKRKKHKHHSTEKDGEVRDEKKKKKKKKKRKKKSKHNDKEKDHESDKDGKDVKENKIEGEDGKKPQTVSNNSNKKDKTKKSHDSDGESGDIEESGESDGEEKQKKANKHKKRKKSKKSRKKKRRHHHERDKSDNEEDGKNNKENSKEHKHKKDGKEGKSEVSDGETEKGNDLKKSKRKKKKKDNDAGSSSDEEKVGKKEIKIEKDLAAEPTAEKKRKLTGDDPGSVDEKTNNMIKKRPSSDRSKGSPAFAKDVPVNSKKVKKEPESGSERKSAGSVSSRKRQTSESSVNESTPVIAKKQKVTPRLSVEAENVKVQDTWSTMEGLYEEKLPENPKSKWDTSDSEIENGLDDSACTKKKLTKTSKILEKVIQKPENIEQSVAKKVKNEVKTVENLKIENKQSTGSKVSKETRSRSRSHSRHHRSYSSSYSRSRSRSRRSYSSSSYDSRHSSHSRSRSYSRSCSRSWSRHRHRSRSYSSYSDYSESRSRSRSSRSRSYSSSRSRSRSRSRKRRYRSYSRSRSSSYSRSRSRSRSRSYRHSRSRRSNSSDRYSHSSRYSSASSKHSDVDSTVKKKYRLHKSDKKQVEKKDNTLDIPLPNLKDDEKSAENLVQKIKDKKQQHSDLVKKGIEASKQAEIDKKNEPKGKDFSDIPLPPAEQGKNSDNIGLTSLALPPPPPPNEMEHYNMPPPQYGPMPFPGGPPPDRMPGPMHPNMRYPPPHGGMHMPPHRMPPGMYPRRGPPPHDMRYGPGPPHMHNGPPRMLPPMHDGYRQRNGVYPMNYPASSSQDKEKSPPPLPPPRTPSPQPPEPPRKEEKPVEEITPNPSIVIPPEQAEQYKRLQEQAQKHAKKQAKRQKKLEAGEPMSDSSSEEEEEEKIEEPVEEIEDVIQEELPTLVAIPSPSLSAPQPTLLIAQPQAAGGLALAPQLVSAGGHPQHILLPQGVALGQGGLSLGQSGLSLGQSGLSLTQGGLSFSQGGLALSQGGLTFSQGGLTFAQAGHPLQAGAPVFALPQPGSSISLAAAAHGAQPAHLPGTIHAPLQIGPAGLPVGAQHSIIAAQHPLLAQSHLTSAFQPQLISPSPMHHGPVIVGNQLLVPRIVRPAI